MYQLGPRLAPLKANEELIPKPWNDSPNRKWCLVHSDYVVRQDGHPMTFESKFQALCAISMIKEALCTQ